MKHESPFSRASLCVVGNVNRDVKSSPLAPRENLFSDGETSVDSITETIGGGGANSACAAAALGARVTFLGKIGADGLGDRLERALAAHGLTPRLARAADQPTGTSIALAFANGHRHFVSCLPASRTLAFADLDLTGLNQHAHLLRADVWFSEPMLFGGNQALFRLAQESGVPVSLDLNWDPAWGSAGADAIRSRKQAVREALPWVDLAHGNRRELLAFTDDDDLETALKRLLDWGVKGVVVHLGASGAGYYSDGVLTIEPAAPVETMVNAAGAGDLLSVVLMLLYQRPEISIPEQLRLANALVAEFIQGKRQTIPPLTA